MSELPKTGDIVDAKYRIDHRIGSGAMSVVYQVTHILTQKRFALKWLLPELALEPDFAARFLREAKVAGRVDHPNIVQVYDLGNPEGTFYMVLELLSGESLQQRIMRVDEVSWADACRLLLPCLDAVAEAHRHGIVHRDLKPANIFVCAAPKNEPERTKVLDFGLAKLARGPGELTLSGTTRSGVVMGTPNYMPLEQMRGEPIDHRVDVYALGVTLYQTLTGRLPFPAASLSDLILLLASAQPAPLERWARRVPEGVSAVVTKALARDRDDRYESVDAMLDALEPFVPAGSFPERRVQRGSAHAPPIAAGAARERRASQRGPAIAQPLAASAVPKLALAQAGEAPHEAQPRRRWLRGAIVIGTVAAGLGAVYGAREYQRASDEAKAAKPVQPEAPLFGPAPAPVGIEAPEQAGSEDVVAAEAELPVRNSEGASLTPNAVGAESGNAEQHGHAEAMDPSSRRPPIQLDTLEVRAQLDPRPHSDRATDRAPQPAVESDQRHPATPPQAERPAEPRPSSQPDEAKPEDRAGQTHTSSTSPPATTAHQSPQRQSSDGQRSRPMQREEF